MSHTPTPITTSYEYLTWAASQLSAERTALLERCTSVEKRAHLALLAMVAVSGFAVDRLPALPGGWFYAAIAVALLGVTLTGSFAIAAVAMRRWTDIPLDAYFSPAHAAELDTFRLTALVQGLQANVDEARGNLGAKGAAALSAQTAAAVLSCLLLLLVYGGAVTMRLASDVSPENSTTVERPR